MEQQPAAPDIMDVQQAPKPHQEQRGVQPGGKRKADEEETGPSKRGRRSTGGTGKQVHPISAGAQTEEEDPAATAAAAAAKQQRAEAAAIAAQAAGALRLGLAEAAAQFEEQRTQRQLFLEVDLAARLGQYEMKGRQVRVLWPADEAWYLGTITDYEIYSGEHTIEYADGDREKVVVALERVRLLMHAGEHLLGPPYASLLQYCGKLRVLAGRKQYAAHAVQLRQRADELEEVARRAEPQHEALQAAHALELQAAHALELERAQAARKQLVLEAEQRWEALKLRAAEAEAALTQAREVAVQENALPADMAQHAQQVRQQAREGGGRPVLPEWELPRVRPPCIAQAVQLAAGLPAGQKLIRVREPGEKTGFKYAVRIQMHTLRTEVRMPGRAEAAVAADLYATWHRLASCKPMEDMACNVPGVEYSGDAVLVEQLKAIQNGDMPHLVRWLRHTLPLPGAEGEGELQQVQEQQGKLQEQQMQQQQQHVKEEAITGVAKLDAEGGEEAEPLAPPPPPPPPQQPAGRGEQAWADEAEASGALAAPGPQPAPLRLGQQAEMEQLEQAVGGQMAREEGEGVQQQAMMAPPVQQRGMQQLAQPPAEERQQRQQYVLFYGEHAEAQQASMPLDHQPEQQQQWPGEGMHEEVPAGQQQHLQPHQARQAQSFEPPADVLGQPGAQPAAAAASPATASKWRGSSLLALEKVAAKAAAAAEAAAAAVAALKAGLPPPAATLDRRGLPLSPKVLAKRAAKAAAAAQQAAEAQAAAEAAALAAAGGLPSPHPPRQGRPPGPKTLAKRAAKAAEVAGAKRAAADAAALKVGVLPLSEAHPASIATLAQKEAEAAADSVGAVTAMGTEPGQCIQQQQQQPGDATQQEARQAAAEHEAVAPAVAAAAASAGGPSSSQTLRLEGAAEQQNQQPGGEQSQQPAVEQGQQQQQQQAAQDQTLQPGEVGWFKVTGYPHWPFMAITREEAAARGVKGGLLSKPGYLPVQYFGNGEVQAINPAAMERGSGTGSHRRGGGGATAGQLGKPCFATFLDGLERGYHAVGKCKRFMEFRSALFEVMEYFKNGQLPPCMLPFHNDGHGADLEEDEEGETDAALAPKHAAKRRKSKAAYKEELRAEAAAAAQGGAGGGPMHVNQNFKVLSLGEVEWLHPGFHNEKYIFPVGYRASRITKTPASGQQEAPHLVEILRSPDGSGPLFRVTPEGGQPVEAATATKAWQALYAADKAGQARSLSISGEHMFGFTSPRVQHAIRSLPGTHRCERYCGWPEGQQPEVPQLSRAELRERLACEARMQQLPQGVRGVPALPGAPGVCSVCNEDEDDEDDFVVQCNKCHVFVHMSCYGIATAPHGNLWLCDVCSLGIKRAPPCVLCPVLGGALKRTSCSRWAHATCAYWLPETHLDPEARHMHLHGLVQDVHQVHRSRFQMKCQVCQQQYGACFQCCEPKCFVGFHPLCARQAGWNMEMLNVSDGEEEELEEELLSQQHPAGQQAQQANQQQREQQQGLAGGGGAPASAAGSGQQATAVGAAGAGREGSCDENDAAAPNGSVHGVGAAQRGGGRKRKPSKRQEGTRRGNVSLLAFCPKHGPVALPAAAAAAGAPPSQQPSAAGAAAAAAAGLLLPSLAASSTLTEHDAGKQQQQQQPSRQPSQTASGSSQLAAGAGSAAAGAGAAAPFAPPVHVWGSARAIPFNHAARRGQRAPEAVAAAEAKRGFVRSVPYLVGGPLQHASRNVPPSSCRRLPSQGAPAGQYVGDEPEPTTAAADETAAAGQTQQQAQQAAAAVAPTQQQQQRQQDRDAAGSGEVPSAAGALLQPRGGGDEQQPWSPPALGHAAAAAAGALSFSPPPGQARLLLSPSRNLLSDADRFREMKATQEQLVTIGKSGIHGWGAFAKRSFRQHDMVIEYVGELLRHSVTDVREWRLYNTLVGAGTYVFRLNDKVCVDATRAGNLAHMLNHSCNPNCHSRTLRIAEGPGADPQDHVIIFASTDIQEHEELTYDYRFGGEEELPCNCGAPNCRGRVNREHPDESRLLVPRSQLRPYRPPRKHAPATGGGPAAAADGGGVAAAAAAAGLAGATAAVVVPVSRDVFAVPSWLPC